MTEVDSEPIMYQDKFDETEQQTRDQDPKVEDSSQNKLDEIRNSFESLQIDGDESDTNSQEVQNKNNVTEEAEEEVFTRDLIDINRNNVNFNKNTLFPGSIQEIDVTVNLKDVQLTEDESEGPFFLKIVASCHNAEFNDLDQYVYSVRSNQRYEYYDQVHFKIKKNDRAEFKVAVKIPTCKEGTVIDGTLSIQLQNAVPVFLPIVSKCEIPTITCLKILQDTTGTQLIKIPGKRNTRIPPLPFKNTSNISCFFQVQTISSQDMSNRAYDIGCASSVVCAANSPFFVMLQLKNNPSYQGPIPKTDTIRKILVLKIRNSSLYFTYPIQVYVYESINGSSAS